MRGRISPKVMAMMINMTPSEAAPRAANKVKRGVEAGGSRPADSSADGAASTGNVPWADLIDHRRDGQYPAHVDTERLGGDDLRDGRAVEFEDEFAPAR
jgi:hypothetical protein